ncbi:MAG TPA: response regulator transcription factor [Chitinophagaceae bacterium]|jgi:two-component system invasion response regulator UvrY|nr:MAG: Oxygen regulatory protein NreC [Bacteroidetes bacterium ADurb.BinA245]HMW65718.1 response regulator transcription factor [Chitinophagaceae bacterium]HMX76826.1 response regulator transcription factor [Chitinophagaceae bacterium]HNA91390.1 response regulator transcription factor [Chitinophagaceae bacterium]HNA95631.1 response regulator transcription factor [Chitinophagaceae bacterium]
METTLPANREIKETMMVQPSILVADDHSMIRKGLKLHLQLTLGYTDITEVGNCNDLMKELVKKKYTHLILDVILSDGSTLEIIPNIIKVYPGLHILVFSMQPAEIYGEAMKQYGIHYYLSKSAGDEEIIQMLRKFLKNEAPVRRIQSVPKTENPFTTLSPRELEILHYVLKGMGTKEIAENLNLKMNTVSTVKARIYEKTNAVNIKELLELATLYNVNY